MTTTKTKAQFPLAPPLRHFKTGDAATVAKLNDMASGGILLSTWERKAGPAGDPWEIGSRQQLEQINSGWTVIVLDQGKGVEAALMGQPLAKEAVSVDSVDAEWGPLVELENLVPGAWCLHVIATLPEHRGQGHGARMMALADTIACESGHDRIALVVSDANAEAIRLYRRRGYYEMARRPMVKGDWDGPGMYWVLMVKPLQGISDTGC